MRVLSDVAYLTIAKSGHCVFEKNGYDKSVHNSLCWFSASNDTRLLSHFPLPTKFVAVELRSLLHCASENGDLAKCRLLSNYFGLTHDISCGSCNFVFRRASQAKHLKVCQWLATHFAMTKDDACVNNNWCFRRAAEGGDLEMCQWLTRHFGLTTEDARVSCLTNDHKDYALRYAFVNGHTKVCEWLLSQFGLSLDEEFKTNSHAIAESEKAESRRVSQMMLAAKNAAIKGELFFSMNGQLVHVKTSMQAQLQND